MTKNSKTVATVAIAALLLAVVLYVGRDLLLSKGRVVHCADGSHPTIDMRDFATQYWAYSAKLETNVADKVKVSTELDPRCSRKSRKVCRELENFGNTSGGC